jgi:hypothetical protein
MPSSELELVEPSESPYSPLPQVEIETGGENWNRGG